MITQTYTYSCDICKRTQSESRKFVLGFAVASPQVPQGWHKLDDNIICGKHESRVARLLLMPT